MTDEKHLDRELERAARHPDDRDARIAELERQLAALRSEAEGEKVRVVEKSLAPSDTDRLDALERQLEEVIGESRSVVLAGDRPAIQVIQRTEVDTGKKKRKPTEGEQEARQVMAWGCSIAAILWMAWCFSATALVR